MHARCRTALALFTILGATRVADAGSSPATHSPPGAAREGSGPRAPFAARPRRPASPRRLMRGYRHVVVHAPVPRGGNGDIAGAYLTAVDMRERLGYRGELTVMTGDRGLEILETMTGQKLAAGGAIHHPNGKIRLHTFQSLRADATPADLYFTVAGVDGSIDDTFVQRVGRRGASNPQDKRIPLAAHGVIAAQPVFGNTEQPYPEWNPHASIARGAVPFEMRRAGLSPHEAGIYRDPVAARLRDRSPAQIARFVRDAVRRMAPGVSRDALDGLLAGRVFAGSEPVLVYGITGTAAHDEFHSYLEGMHATAVAQGRSFTLVTPSSYGRKYIPEHLRPHVRYVHARDAARLPARARAGKIYILETETLPHEVFIGLMAHSHAPPIVAGDGALAAAVDLHKPFVATGLVHNRRNIAAYGKRLREQLSVEAWQQVASAFEPQASTSASVHFDLSKAMGFEAPEIRAAFARASQSIAPLTDHVLEAARDLRSVQSDPVPDAFARVRDPVLRNALAFRAAARGETQAVRLAARLIEHYPRRVDTLFASGLLTRRHTAHERLRRAVLRAARARGGPNSYTLAQLGLLAIEPAAPMADSMAH